MKDHLSLSSNPHSGERTVWVAAVALIGGDGRVLVQQRPENTQHGTLWEFPGGKLEAGESAEAAAIREIAEELSIHVAREDLLPVAFASGETQVGPAPRSLVILLFACTNWRGTPRANAAAKLAWCDPAELRTWRMPPLDYPLADSLVKMLAENAI